MLEQHSLSLKLPWQLVVATVLALDAPTNPTLLPHMRVKLQCAWLCCALMLQGSGTEDPPFPPLPWTCSSRSWLPTDAGIMFTFPTLFQQMHVLAVAQL